MEIFLSKLRGSKTFYKNFTIPKYSHNLHNLQSSS
jgi:hypothetical protein